MLISESCIILRYYAARNFISLSTFRDDLSVFSWPLKIDCPETSVRNCRYSLRNNPEESSFHLLRGESMKSLMLITVFYKQVGVHNECVPEGKTVNSELICGNKMPTRCNRGFYCRSYCLLNMFRASPCPSSGAQEYYTVVAACGILCCGFFK